MDTPILALQSADLTLRTTARADRARVLDHLERNGTVILDLSRAELMSAAYADELFGAITQYFGARWVLDRIAIAGANDAIVRTIAEAIHQRARLRRQRRPARGSSAPAGALRLRH